MENKYIHIKRIQSATKKRVIYSSLFIGSILLGLISAFAWLSFDASMLGSDKDYTWEAQEGDRFYIAIRDKYNWIEDDELIREFSAILKSEILKVEDLAIDLDNDDDLMIMSSFLLGREDLFSFEIPNYFDLYNTLLLGYNLIEMIETENYFNETSKLFYPSMPSAVHFVSSGVYHEVEQLVEDLDLGRLTDSEFPIFNDVFDFFSFFKNNIEKISAWNESFTDYHGLGGAGYVLDDNSGSYVPRYRIEDTIYGAEGDYLGINYWNYNTSFPDNNTARLFERFDGDFGITMYQDENTKLNGKDDLQVDLQIFDAWLNNTEFGEEFQLSDFYFKPSIFSFDLDLHQRLILPDENTTNSHTLEIGLKGNDFNITGNIDGYDFDFSGYNGIQLRFENGILQYHTGNYTFDTSVPLNSHWRPSTLAEEGWNNVSSDHYNFTEIFGESSDYGELMNIEIQPTFATVGGLGSIFDIFKLIGLGEATEDRNTFNIIITDRGEGISSYSETFSNIPLHVDCPFDFLNAKNNDLIDTYSIFRWENMSQMYFKMYDTEDNPSKDYFDDIILNGYVYDSDTHFYSLMDGFLYSQLFLLSFYHTLFYPLEFDYEIITSTILLLNELMEYFTEIPDFYVITEDPNILEISVNSERINELTDIILFSLMDLLGYSVDYEWINSMEGDVDFNIKFRFDKRINILNDTFIEIFYNDLGMYREIGMSLVAIATKEGNAKYDRFYPAFPEDVLGDQFDSIIAQSVMGIIVASLISVGGSVGIVELIHYIRKRRERS